MNELFLEDLDRFRLGFGGRRLSEQRRGFARCGFPHNRFGARARLADTEFVELTLGSTFRRVEHVHLILAWQLRCAPARSARRRPILWQPISDTARDIKDRKSVVKGKG